MEAIVRPFTSSIESPRSRLVECNRRRLWLAAGCFPILLLALGCGLHHRLNISASEALSAAILFAVVAVCAVTDLRWKKIPNWATYSAFLWAVLISTSVSYYGTGSASREIDRSQILAATALPVGIAQCLSGALVCFLVMLVIHSISPGGAGDVKLATAIGSLVGVQSGILIICYSFILAGVASLGIVIWTLGPWFILCALSRRVGSILLPFYVGPPTTEQSNVLKRPLPLGIFFALGTFVAALDLPGLVR